MSPSPERYSLFAGVARGPGASVGPPGGGETAVEAAPA